MKIFAYWVFQAVVDMEHDLLKQSSYTVHRLQLPVYPALLQLHSDICHLLSDNHLIDKISYH
uniref:Ovule protein n=1 Tax=Brugia timori TaxID=42155 RepID=A0A0R3QHV9_9BILA